MSSTSTEKTADASKKPWIGATTRLLLLGLVFHLAYIPIVFDCYFTSPVVNGMQQFVSPIAPAKRVVLIVGDGLRADLLFNTNPFPAIPDSPKVVAPYLRNIAEQRGAFGVSHTRVPTESRPGHVAIIGGMYEDVSAVTKGWKTNPVNFDSVFNQSSTTFSFGSPDILPMFAKGATPGKVHMWCYDEHEEDFTKDATALDEWSFNHLELLLRNASSNPELDGRLRSDRAVFFLHLLGLDTTGHSYRPHSKAYMKNIQVVDEIVEKTEKLFAAFYNDDKTAFIFTADHGMSNIGNHGDGDPDSTRTPLIAWGAGIRGPLADPRSASHDAYSVPWDLLHLVRRDVEQADIAPLMSVLIGSSLPVNSVGILPDIKDNKPGYLDQSLTDEVIANLAFVNAKATHSLFYTPFPGLRGEFEPGGDIVNFIDAQMRAEDWKAAKKTAGLLIKTTLQGLRYLQTYDRILLRAIATVGYLGWAAYSGIFLLRYHLNRRPMALNPSMILTALSAAVLLAFWTIFTLQSSPATFYIYVSFPVYFWHEVLQYMFFPSPTEELDDDEESGSRWASFGKGTLYVLLVIWVLREMVHGYTERLIWGMGYIVIGLFWPFPPWSIFKPRGQLPLLIAWKVSTCVSAIFPFLPVEKTESVSMINFGAGLMILLEIFVMAFSSPEVRKTAPRGTFRYQIILIILSAILTSGSVRDLQAKQGLSKFNQWASWLILVLSVIEPFRVRKRIQDPIMRITSYFLGFGPYMIILSISEEALFYASFAGTLILWIAVESSAEQNRLADLQSRGEDAKESTPKRGLRSGDLRIALFFLFFVQAAFFGTGKSFYLEPVYRLVPVFSPFLMASLLILKIIAPYVVLSAAFATLNDQLGLAPFSLFMVALTLTDGMTVAFFYNVRDHGSWLEIGQTISFFVISSLLLVWSAGVCAAGRWLMAGSLGSQSRTKIE
ncbi:alkaline phosphatase-like protein [Sistotremastrum niveocremeum HHB9708]|uniref:GPI ethanolamine phosphate transferase 1 n=1 Tax=Sistotremastrum niveocremeum HHB9708 TaxID=1314777 RepID=A0A164QCV4_9AGAM|nr:alkaline phosphatase-like protein [Sistotremastrum niveocremeum HHB9708]